jgi:hypothetical protein
MASVEDAKTKILALIELLLDEQPPMSIPAGSIRDLAEAYAWLERPDQPHGR